MQQSVIYRITSVGRPLDPAFPTNRAVMMLSPLAALLAAGLAFLQGSGAAAAASAGLSGLLVTFGAWALTRELAPDDDPAAFVSAALALVALLVAGAESVLPLFAALMLVRIVNRTTGLAPRPLDAPLVAGLALWTAHSLQQPLLGAVAALAFALDAVLPGGRRWQLVPAVVCAAAGVALGMRDGVALGLPAAGAVTLIVVAVAGAAFLALIVLTTQVRSLGDVGENGREPQPLSLTRVRAGMAIGLFVALQSLLTEGGGQRVDVLLWACIAGVVLGAVFSRRGTSAAPT